MTRPSCRARPRTAARRLGGAWTLGGSACRTDPLHDLVAFQPPRPASPRRGAHPIQHARMDGVSTRPRLLMMLQPDGAQRRAVSLHVADPLRTCLTAEAAARSKSPRRLLSRHGPFPPAAPGSERTHFQPRPWQALHGGECWSPPAWREHVCAGCCCQTLSGCPGPGAFHTARTGPPAMTPVPEVAA